VGQSSAKQKKRAISATEANGMACGGEPGGVGQGGGLTGGVKTIGLCNGHSGSITEVGKKLSTAAERISRIMRPVRHAGETKARRG